MSQSSWYDRWRQRRKERQASSCDAGKQKPRWPSLGLGVGQAGPRTPQDSPLSTRQATDYLLDSFRINAPGYADQDAFTMSRAFVGITYLAVDTFATMASQAEVTLYEEDEDDPDEKIPLSSREDCVKLIRQPNPDDTFGEILEQIALQERLTGTALVWTPYDEHDKNDVPEDMYVLSTASVLPQPISPRYPHGAYLVQPWYPAGPYAQIPVSMGVGSIIPAEQIIRVKKPHPFFRWIGYSVQYAISAQIDVARMIDVSRLNTNARGIDPTAILSFDPSVKQPDEAALRRLEAQFANIWQGPQNAGRLIVAPAGATLSKLSNTPEQMAYESGWTQLLDFALASFGVNKALAGMTDSMSYATLFASLKAFYINRLDPFLSRLAAKFTQQLLRKFWDDRFCMELQGKSITDDSVQGQQHQRLIQANAIKVGELRKAYGLDPSDRDDEWVQGDPKDQQQGGAGGAPGGQPGAPPGGGGDEEQGGDDDSPLAQLLGGLGGGEEEGAQEQDQDVESNRPDNEQGKGALGEQKSWRLRQRGGIDETLAGRLDRAMSRGTIGHRSTRKVFTTGRR